MLTTSIRRTYYCESAFREQRKSAKQRGIPFLLSFKQWLAIWKRSGHLHERGCKRGQYVMARKNDCGPYAIGNVKIITHVENSREWIRTAEYREQQRQGSTGRKMSRRAKRLISSARRGVYQGGFKKLTPDLVRQIRAEYIPNVRGRGTVSLARKYGVVQGTIWNVVAGKRWAQC